MKDHRGQEGHEEPGSSGGDYDGQQHAESNLAEHGVAPVSGGGGAWFPGGQDRFQTSMYN